MADETRKSVSVAQLQEFAARNDERFKALEGRPQALEAEGAAMISAAVAASVGAVLAAAGAKLNESVQAAVTVAIQASLQPMLVSHEDLCAMCSQLQADAQALRAQMQAPRVGRAQMPDGGVIEMTVTNGVGTARLPDGRSIQIAGPETRM